MTVQLDGWRPTSQQVGQVLDAFIDSDPEAGASRFRALKVTTPPGDSWTFDSYEEFHAELDVDRYQAFSLMVGDRPVSMHLSFFGSWTAFDADLPSRSALEGLVAFVRSLSQQ